MSDRSDFWKELMGDDGEIPFDDDQEKEPAVDNRGFVIEYLNRDGEPISAPETPQDADLTEAEPKHTEPQAQPVYDDDIKPQAQPIYDDVEEYEEPSDDEPAEAQKAPDEEPAKTQKASDEEPAKVRVLPLEDTCVHAIPLYKQGKEVPPETLREDGGDVREQFFYGDEDTEEPSLPLDAAEQKVQPLEGKLGDQGKDEADDFTVDFDFDKEYGEVKEKPIKRGQTKRFGCLGGILFFTFVLVVSVILACLGWKAAVDVLGLGKEDKTVEVTIPKSAMSDKTVKEKDEDGNVKEKTVTSADIDYVADTLYESGLIKYKWLFKLYSKFSTADETIKAGTYQLNMDYDYRALVNGMTPSGGVRVETTITIPEGYTIQQIAALLEENKVCDKNEFLDAAANYDFQDYDFIDHSTLGDVRRLEGYLFPDTYNVYVGDAPARVINKMLSNFDDKWTDKFQAQADALGYSMRDVINIAAMIEKEAGADSERATIASVIYNRLENPEASTVGLLNIDATIYYAIEGTDKEFSVELDDPYNTYIYKGLPPGPISNPGLASIKAALWPEDTGYYYYGLGKDGTHQFFKYYDSFVEFLNSDEYGG